MVYGFFWLFLLVGQGVATAILLSRLGSAPRRIAPLTPVVDSPPLPVSVVIPTLNEAQRLPRGLEGLRHQAAAEILVVDSRSTDGTPAYVQGLAPTFAPPLKLLTDDPLPEGWVGRPWALDYGYRHTDPASTWILGIDADTRPQPGLVAALVAAAERENLDVVSLSPQFLLESPGDQWLQPALLVTLVYRFGATGDRAQFSPERVMANGQCFLVRRSVLQALDGYTLARRSFCDDVTLARAAAQRGFAVGFLDGAKVLQVRMYESAAETWREWGRSLDLKDAATPAQTWSDCLFLLAVQGLPLPVWLTLTLNGTTGAIATPLLYLNGFLVAVRVLLLLALRQSYGPVGLWFWLSPLADPLAVWRIWLSASRTPKQWRGRVYGERANNPDNTATKSAAN
ncbi:MAG: glycosyltransferase family 2 protein [Pseudanabaenaceae cyanobacterium]